MLKKLDMILNIVIGAFIGNFIGSGIYNFWHFKTYPDLYFVYPAPWYTSIFLCGAVTVIVVAVAAIIKLIIRKKSKK